MRFGVIIGMVGAIAGSAAVAGASYYGWGLYQAGSIEKRLDGFNKLKDTLDFDISHKREVGEAFTPGFALEDVVISSDDKRIAVERIEFKRFDWKTPHRPSFSHVVFTGMKITPDLFEPLLGPDMTKALAEAEVPEVVADLSFEHEAGEETAEDPKTKQKVTRKAVSIREIRIELRKLGTITASVELKDFDVKPRAVARLVRESPPLVRLLGEQVQFAGLKAAFEDKGLMKAIVAAKSSEIARNELQARGHFVRALQREASAIRSALASNRFDPSLFQPMMQYFEQYDRRAGFTFTAAPPEPIELRRLFAMWDRQRGNFYNSFNPRFAMGATRAAPKKEAPKKEEPKKKEDPKKPDKPAR